MPGLPNLERKQPQTLGASRTFAAARGRGSAPGHGESADLAHHGGELLRQRALVVRDAVALADLLHLDRDLRVAERGDVGEQVVLDLVRQIAGQDVEQLSSGEVGRAEDLPEVPLRSEERRVGKECRL